MLLAAVAALALLQNAPCRGEAARRVEEAARLAAEFNLIAAADGYGAAAREGCGFAATVAIYVRGLVAARAAETQFGSAASLQPVKQAIAALAPAAAADPVVRIMQAVLQAAVPAAQHERAEMALQIDEMLRRESLQLEAKLPPVPVLSAHEAAGNFWLQLHVYDEAARAFAIAAQRVGQTPSVLLGAARSAAGQKRLAAACEQYQRLIAWWGSRSGSPPEMTEARAYVKQPACATPVPPGARR